MSSLIHLYIHYNRFQGLLPTDGLYGGYVGTWAGITANQHVLMKTSEENGQLLTRGVTDQLKREYKTDGRLFGN